MTDYISREAALMKLMQDGCSAKNLQSISDVPAADVAEVVRCRDCKHKVRTDANGIVICSEEHGMYCPTESDFCRYGEYRTNTGGVTE
mgnify:FL=1|jgi:hypothetical protein